MTERRSGKPALLLLARFAALEQRLDPAERVHVTLGERGALVVPFQTFGEHIRRLGGRR